jgi:hypothetical protein
VEPFHPYPQLANNAWTFKKERIEMEYTDKSEWKLIHSIPT